MRQKGYFGSAKKERFEDGVLRADSCCQRYSVPRKYQERTRGEDLSCLSFGSRALREESRLISDVHRLICSGIRPSGSEPLDEFVEKHRDMLGGD